MMVIMATNPTQANLVKEKLLCTEKQLLFPLLLSLALAMAKQPSLEDLRFHGTQTLTILE
jgi:hypothetical protein